MSEISMPATRRTRRKERSTVVLLVGSLLLVSACQRYSDPIFANVIQESRVYAQVIDEHGLPQDLELELFQAEGNAASNRPLVVFAHGGGFTHGNQWDPWMIDRAREFARMGYVTASISYRLHEGLDTSNYTLAEWRVLIDDAQLDVQSAVRYLTSQPDLRIDAERVVLVGWSAGAVASLHAAFRTETTGLPAGQQPAEVLGVVSLMGITGDEFILDNSPEDPESVLFFHGEEDTLVPFTNAQSNCASLEATGGTCTMVSYPTYAHWFPEDSEQERLDLMIDTVFGWVSE